MLESIILFITILNFLFFSNLFADFFKFSNVVFSIIIARNLQKMFETLQKLITE